MEDETLRITMLMDFFGDLLTEKQREYLDLYRNDDLSLSEIAEKKGITKQGVHDIITRAEKRLDAIEKKTGVVQRWLDAKAELLLAETMARELLQSQRLDTKSAESAQKLVLALGRLKDQ